MATLGVLALGIWAVARNRAHASVAGEVAGQLVLLAAAAFLDLSLGGGYSC